MSVNKRILTREQTLEHLESKTLSELYAKVDVFIFYDEVAHRVYDMFMGGMKETQIKKLIKNKL